jgi:hypothetical protein
MSTRLRASRGTLMTPAAAGAALRAVAWSGARPVAPASARNRSRGVSASKQRLVGDGVAEVTLDAHAEFDTRQAVDAELAFQRGIEVRGREPRVATMQFAGHGVHQCQQGVFGRGRRGGDRGGVGSHWRHYTDRSRA